MEKASSLLLTKDKIISVAFDILCISVMYFVPAVSHLLNLPIYLIEPLRIMIILALVHTKRQNAYFIALTLPLFSTLISGHPFFAKMLIMSLELFLNVVLFFTLSSRIKNSFLAMVSAIVISKAVYYLLAYAFIQKLAEVYGIGEHPLWIQAIVTLCLGGYTYIILRNKELKNS